MQVTVPYGGATYRVGAEWQPGNVHGNNETPVRLIFQIDRLEPSGPQPVGAKDVQVTVTCAERHVRETLPATVPGPGAYEVQRMFTTYEVGPNDVSYEVTIAFRDPTNGAEVPPGSVVFPLAATPAR